MRNPSRRWPRPFLALLVVLGTATPAAAEPTPMALSDSFVADGSNAALAVDPGEPTHLVAAYEETFPYDTPESVSLDATESWTVLAVPGGGTRGVFRDPRVIAGNESGEFFSSFVRADDTAERGVVFGGAAGAPTNLFTLPPATVAPRIDVDRTEMRGGGTGAIYDGVLYLTL